MTAEEILAAAIEKKTPAERAAYLDAACRQDAALRAIVEGLLKSHEEARSFLEQPLFESAVTIERPDHEEKPGAQSVPTSFCNVWAKGAWAPFTWPSRSIPCAAVSL